MTYKTIAEWLGEVENYGVRAERIPAGAYPWIAEAWKLGALAAQQDEAIDQEEIAKVLAYELEHGSAHGARVAPTPHLDNYSVHGRVNLLALAAAVVARLEQGVSK